jgi:hypothetical protein
MYLCKIQRSNFYIFPFSLHLVTRMLPLGLSYAIRLSTKNFGFENGIQSVPLYAAYLL